MRGPIYLSTEIRHIEQAAKGEPLMQRAGAAAAGLAMKLVSETAKEVLVLVGPGNNGGDALIVAEQLKQKFFRVSVAKESKDIPEKPWGLIIDGLFGLGLARDVEGDYARMIDYANRQRCPVLALDIPSGLHSDSGKVMGRAVRASHTITFIALKPGLLTLDGPDHCGEVSVASLGLTLDKPTAWVADKELFKEILKPRPYEFHKGMAGSLGILGGAAGMTGAALLAGRAALKLGAGKVFLGLLEEDTIKVDPNAPELMLRHADDLLGLDLDALVVGPGLGQGERAETLVGAALSSDIACVLDADALNLIAGSSSLRNACARRTAETLITPHPGEAARLLAESVATVQADRVAAAKSLSRHFNAHALLKGNGSVLVARDGHWFINTSGNPGMASAGMGDVLAGMLGALLAQRYTGETALVLGTHLHGAAADELVRQGSGPVGLTAGELLEPARRLWNAWLAGRA